MVMYTAPTHTQIQPQMPKFNLNFKLTVSVSVHIRTNTHTLNHTRWRTNACARGSARIARPHHTHNRHHSISLSLRPRRYVVEPSVPSVFECAKAYWAYVCICTLYVWRVCKPCAQVYWAAVFRRFAAPQVNDKTQVTTTRAHKVYGSLRYKVFDDVYSFIYVVYSHLYRI